LLDTGNFSLEQLREEEEREQCYQFLNFLTMFFLNPQKSY